MALSVAVSCKTEVQSSSNGAATRPSATLGSAESRQLSSYQPMEVDAPAALRLLRSGTEADISRGAVGLALLCRAGMARGQHQGSLLARAASLLASEDAHEQAFIAISQAVEQCSPADASGQDHTEALLRGWLSSGTQQARGAARALAGRSGRRRSLHPETILALLPLRNKFPLEVWFALSHLNYRAESLRAQVARHASEALTQTAGATAATRWLLGTLAQTGPDGVDALSDFSTSNSPDRLREAALKGLGQAGETGQKKLLELLLSPRLTPSPRWDLALLSSLKPRTIQDHLAEIVALSRTPLPPDDPAKRAARRDVIALRCAAASLLANTSSLSQHLQQCQPGGGQLSDLATLEVLGREELSGPRHSVWLRYARSDDPLLRQQALRLLVHFPDTEQAEPELAKALQDHNPGTVATAARVIRDIGKNGGLKSPSPALIAGLKSALTGKAVTRDAVATEVSLLQAIEALQVLSLKGVVAERCKSTLNPVRSAASAALMAMRSQTRCSPILRSKLTRSGTPTKRLLIRTTRTEASIDLDLSGAPAHVQRLQELVSSGFFVGQQLIGDDLVLSFGDQDADGFADGTQDVLAGEYSAQPFSALSFGAAQSGLDSSSTQFFVSLYDRPDLDFQYPVLGSAAPSWTELRPGDVVLDAKLVDLP